MAEKSSEIVHPITSKDRGERAEKSSQRPAPPEAAPKGPTPPPPPGPAPKKDE